MCYLLALSILFIMPAYGMKVDDIDPLPSLSTYSEIVTQICSSTQNSDEALNKVCRSLPPLSPDLQAKLLQKILLVPAFTHHVEAIIQKMARIFSSTSLTTLHNDIGIIQATILGGLLPLMRRFVCDRFRARYDWMMSDSADSIGCFLIPSSAFKIQDMLASDAGIFCYDEVTKRIVRKKKETLLRPRDKYVLFKEQVTPLEQQEVDLVFKNIETGLKKKIRIKNFDRIVALSHDGRIALVGKADNWDQSYDDRSWVRKEKTCDYSGHSESYYELEGNQGTDYYAEINLYLCSWDKGSLEHFNTIHFHRRDSSLAILIPQMILFSHNDQLFCVFSNYGFDVRETVSKKTVIDASSSTSPEHRENFSGVFSHDDALLVVSSDVRPTLRFYSTLSGQYLFSIKSSAYINAFKFFPDDLYFAIALQDGLRVFEKGTIEHMFLKKAQFNRNGWKNAEENWFKIPFFSAYFKEKKEEELNGKRNSLLLVLSLFAARNRRLLDQTQNKLTDASCVLDDGMHDIVPICPLIPQLTCKLNNDDKPYTYLAIDGEGIQVLTAASLLHSFEKYVRMRQGFSNCHIYELFDCIVASSFASILAFGLTATHNYEHPLYTPEKLMKFLPQLARSVFLSKENESPYYRSEPLKKALREQFKDLYMSDVLTQVRIPLAKRTMPETKEFDTIDAQSSEFKDFPLHQVVQAACSSSEYFPKVTLEPLVKKEAGEAAQEYCASSQFKNNATFLLRNMLPVNLRNCAILYISTGVMNEANSLRHQDLEKLKKKGLNYCRLLPSIPQSEIGKPDDTNAVLLEGYARSAEKVVEENVGFMNCLLGMQARRNARH